MNTPYKIKFFIYGYRIDYFKFLFKETINSSNITYFDDPVSKNCKNPLKKGLYYLYRNQRIREILLMNNSSFWKRYTIPNLKNSGDYTCFIFFMRWLKPDNRFIFENIKCKYPKAKIVVYFEDLYETGIGSLDYSIIKEYADLVISYDKEDAIKYEFEYHSTFMSYLKEIGEKIKPINDISYIGASKHRYKEILKVYDIFIDKGLSCDFVVFRLNKNQAKIKGIKYIKHLIPYTTYLKRTLQAKCILELMQQGASGYTLRTWEALMYNRILITNNKSILNASFYNPSQFIYFETPEDLKKITLPTVFPSRKPIKYPSPTDFLNFVKDKLYND